MAVVSTAKPPAYEEGLVPNPAQDNWDDDDVADDDFSTRLKAELN